MSNLAYKYDVMKKEELIDGKIVMMSPRPAINHERIQRNILRIICMANGARLLARRRSGWTKKITLFPMA